MTQACPAPQPHACVWVWDVGVWCGCGGRGGGRKEGGGGVLWNISHFLFLSTYNFRISLGSDECVWWILGRAYSLSASDFLQTSNWRLGTRPHSQFRILAPSDQIQRFSKFLQFPVATASTVWANQRAEFKFFCTLMDNTVLAFATRCCKNLEKRCIYKAWEWGWVTWEWGWVTWEWGWVTWEWGWVTWKWGWVTYLMSSCSSSWVWPILERADSNSSPWCRSHVKVSLLFSLRMS